MSAREGKEPTPRGDVGGTDDAGQAAEAARHIPRGTDEHADHGWFAAEGKPEILFDTPTDERWGACFKAAGIDTRLLSSETGVA